jgi:hypothetical protein
MSQKETVQIAKRVYTVHELTIQQIHDLTSQPDEATTDPISSLLAMATDMTIDDMMPMTPSELGQIIDAMVKVNTPFLEQAARINAQAAAEALERMIRSISLIAFMPSSSQVTE